MQITRVNRAENEAQELQPRGLGSETDTEIVTESAEIAEISRLNQASRSAVRARMEAVAELRERYGDRPIPERVWRANGLGHSRNTNGGKRGYARRERVLAAARALHQAGLAFTFRELAMAVGDEAPGGAARVRNVVAELVRLRQWPAGIAGVRNRQTGG